MIPVLVLPLNDTQRLSNLFELVAALLLYLPSYVANHIAHGALWLYGLASSLHVGHCLSD